MCVGNTLLLVVEFLFDVGTRDVCTIGLSCGLLCECSTLIHIVGCVLRSIVLMATSQVFEKDNLLQN